MEGLMKDFVMDHRNAFVNLYYRATSQLNRKTAPVLRIFVGGHTPWPPLGPNLVRYVEGRLYLPKRGRMPFKGDYQMIFQTRAPKGDADAIVAGIRGAKAAFKRATGLGPLAQLDLIHPSIFMREPIPGGWRGDVTSDMEDYIWFVRKRMRRELARRVRHRVVTIAGTLLSRRGIPQDVRELILRQL